MKTLIRSSDRCAFMVIIDTLPLLHHDISARYISRYNVHALPTADRSLQHRRSDVRACARAPVARLCVEDHPVKTVSVSAGVFAYDGKHARECPGIPDSYFSLNIQYRVRRNANDHNYEHTQIRSAHFTSTCTCVRLNTRSLIHATGMILSVSCNNEQSRRAVAVQLGLFPFNS
jgi:hypothetical protein